MSLINRLEAPMKLKLDKNFKPCPVADGDELYPNGILEFNITQMIKYIQKNKDKFSPERIDITIISDNISFASIDENHLSKVDISIPIILAEISPTRFNIVDGNHRAVKASRSGNKNIQAYRIYPNEHTMFLTSEDAYIKYVEYWNVKLLDL